MAKATKNPQIVQITDEEEKKKALANTLSAIEKQYGKGAIMKLGDNTAMQVDAISTGSLGLDLALGVGGVPRGRIIEVFGPESSGKTTLALHILAEAQKLGGTAAFIDAEHALDPVYAKALGVNIDDLYVSQPDTGEQALEICEALVRSGAVDIDGDMGDSHVGLQARLMSQALRKLAGLISKTNCICLFINQLREKVGVMFGNPETTTGGKALKFYATIRLDIRRSEQLKAGNEIVGNRTKIKVVKNKVAPPFKTCEFDILYGKGISHEGSVLDLAVENDFVQKSGAWFNYGDVRIGQGRENARQYLIDHKDVCDELEAMIREKLLAPKADDGEPAEIEVVKEEGPEAEQMEMDPDDFDDEP